MPVAAVTGFLSFEDEPPLELVAFDVETTGLSADSAGITEIGAVRFLSDGTILDTFVSFTNPGYRISKEITRLTGITDAMICGAQPTARVLKDWMEWLGPSPVLVAHNAPFDLQFIHAVQAEPEFLVIDTLPWARQCVLPVVDHKLETLLRYIGYDAKEHHRAEADARGVAALCAHLVAREGAAPNAPAVRERLTRRCEGSRALCGLRGRRPARS
jgi:DNA polymerase III epsilon subunit family exonuclease